MIAVHLFHDCLLSSTGQKLTETRGEDYTLLDLQQLHIKLCKSQN